MALSVPVSLIFSVLNEGARLRETIQSVLSADLIPAEILIIDDGSTDGCAEQLDPKDSAASAVRVFHRPHIGIAGARSYGASIAAEPALVFLDAHCDVARDWLDPLIEQIDRTPDAIAIPAVSNSEQASDWGCGAFLINDILAYQWYTNDPPPAQVGIAPGGCFAMRASLLKDLGGFAAMRDFGLEDVELSLRAWRFGCTIRTVPESRVGHDFRSTSPYRMRADSWLANVLLTALLHFDPERLERTLQAAAGFASFAAAISSVLASDWITRKVWIDARTIRGMGSYWQSFSTTNRG